MDFKLAQPDCLWLWIC